MSQTSLDFSSFSEAVQNDFLQLTKTFQKRIIITYPKQLRFFVQRILGHQKIAGEEAKGIYQFTDYEVGFKELKENVRGTIVFVTIPDPEFVSHALKYFKNMPHCSKVLFTIPRSSAIISQVLSNFNYTLVDYYPKNPETEVFVHEFHADFLPVDNSYFLLPCYNSFSKIFVDHDTGDIFAAARALSKIQTIFGQIPQVITVGETAEKCNEIITGILNQSSFAKSCFPQIDTLLIIDRTADLITPFIFSGTGEQLIDNIFGIQYGKFVKDGDTLLSQSNRAFADLRSLSYSETMKSTTDFVNKMKEVEEFTKSKGKNKGYDPKFFTQFSKYKRLIDLRPNYSQIIDIINECQQSINSDPAFTPCFNAEIFVLQGKQFSLLEEHLISIFNDWQNALRMIFLESACSISHSEKFVQSVQREILAEFGSKVLTSLIKLDKLGLLSSSKFYYDWSKVRNTLNLIDTPDPNPDGSYTYKEPIFSHLNGYCPLTCRLADIAKGETVTPPQCLSSPQVRMTVTGEKPPFVEGSTRRVLVFFIGGVTLSEVGIIRDIGLKSEGKYEFIVGSTDQCNSKQFIQQICPFLNNSENQ